MATCKDCIHYGICEYSTITDKQVKCKDFIFKEDYVKVVRCKYCKYGEEIFIDENEYRFCQLAHNIHHINDFCNYGKLKERLM
ncbi:MAG: hypothetical protein PUC23_03550 [bacterium]|nr:hypothetical protein [bacterium]